MFYSSGLNGNMAFETTLITYEGNSDWVDATIRDAKDCLESKTLPANNNDCDNCRYFIQRKDIEYQYDE